MDLLRGTNINVGFGTELPYLRFGSPWLATKFFKEKLDMLDLPGLTFREVSYRPKGSPYYNRIPKYNGKSCSGIEISISDKKLVKPLETATSIITLISQLHPREFKWEGQGYIDKLFGSNQLSLFVAQKKPPGYLSPWTNAAKANYWQKRLENQLSFRMKWQSMLKNRRERT